MEAMYFYVQLTVMLKSSIEIVMQNLLNNVFWKLVLHFRGDTSLSDKSVAIVEIEEK